jgi:hypothetical protein
VSKFGIKALPGRSDMEVSFEGRNPRRAKANNAHAGASTHRHGFVNSSKLRRWT